MGEISVDVPDDLARQLAAEGVDASKVLEHALRDALVQVSGCEHELVRCSACGLYLARPEGQSPVGEGPPGTPAGVARGG